MYSSVLNCSRLFWLLKANNFVFIYVWNPHESNNNLLYNFYSAIEIFVEYLSKIHIWQFWTILYVNAYSSGVSFFVCVLVTFFKTKFVCVYSATNKCATVAVHKHAHAHTHLMSIYLLCASDNVLFRQLHWWYKCQTFHISC